MKICIIAGLYDPYILGGGEIYLKNVVPELSKEHKIIIITTKPYNSLNSLKCSFEATNNIKIYRFYPLNFYYSLHVKKHSIVTKMAWQLMNIWNIHSYIIVKSILEKEKPDLVHINSIGGLSLSIFSAIRFFKIPCVYTICSSALISPYGAILEAEKKIGRSFVEPLYREITRRFSKSIDMVIAVSKFILERHLQYGFFQNSNHAILPNPVNEEIKPAPKKYDIIDILYVGYLSRYKGVDTLINEFKQLEHDNIRLHIVGTGPDLAEFKKNAGFDQRINFYGFKSGDELWKLYQKANVTVVPSSCHEAFGIVIIESFASATPVIGSNVGAIPEIIEEDIT